MHTIKELINNYENKINECKVENNNSLMLMKKSLTENNEILYNVYKDYRDTNIILINIYRKFINKIKNI